MLQIARDSGLPMPRGMQTLRRPMQPLRRDPTMPDMFVQPWASQGLSQAHASTSQHRDGTVGSERRTPPEDLNDSQRRQRPRHEPAYAASAGRGSRQDILLPGPPLSAPDSQQRHSSVAAMSQQHSPVRQTFSPSHSYNQPQHNEVNDLWARRAQTLHTSQQHPSFQRGPNFPHQSQASAVGSATLAPLPFIQHASTLSDYVPPINTSANNGPMPRVGSYQPYHNTNGSSNLQPPMSAEPPPGTAYPGPPPPQSPAFYQQLPQLGHFQNASYPPPDSTQGVARHSLSVAGPNGYYAPP